MARIQEGKGGVWGNGYDHCLFLKWVTVGESFISFGH